MPKKIKYTIYAILTVLAIYICIPGNILHKAYADESGNESTIAGVPVSDLNEEEMTSALQSAIDAWLSGPMIVSGAGQEVAVDPSQLAFDIGTSVAQYEAATDKPWFAFWESEKVVHLPLQVTLLEDAANGISAITSWDSEATMNAVATQASYLKEHEVEAVLTDFTQVDNERLALAIKEIPGDSADVQNLVKLLEGTILLPGETFSFVEKVGESTASRQAKNFVASSLYETVLHTEFEITERHAHEQLPAYTDAGLDASINLQYNEDLRFVNSSAHAAQIAATVEGSQLKMEIYSTAKEKEVLVQIAKEEISPRIINRYSEDLAVGQEKLVQEGQKGIRTKVTRIVSEKGSATEEQISRDYYAPTNRIMLVSTKQPEPVSTPDETAGDPSSAGGKTGADTGTDSDIPASNTDPDTQIDMDNNDLPDVPLNQDEKQLPKGKYYDKGGNVVTP